MVVGAAIEAEDSILDRVTSGQHQHGRLEPALSERLQDLETAAAGKHDVENEEIEHLRVGLKESVLAGLGYYDVVVLGFQGGSEHLGQLALVFDDQHSHRLRY